MVDRIALMRAVERSFAPSETQRIAIRKKVDAALSAMVLTLPLEGAIALPAKEKEELGHAIEGVLTHADLKKLAKLWEPARAIDASNDSQLGADLVSLMRQERPPYAKPTLSLAQARALRGEERSIAAQAIERLAPLKDLKALAKKWDKENAETAAMTRRALVAHLRALMEGYVEPVAKPAAAGRQRNSAPPARSVRAAAE